jgi:hypothetical protein
MQAGDPMKHYVIMMLSSRSSYGHNRSYCMPILQSGDVKGDSGAIQIYFQGIKSEE